MPEVSSYTVRYGNIYQWQTVAFMRNSFKGFFLECNQCDTHLQHKTSHLTRSQIMFMLFYSQDNKYYVPLA